MVHTFAIIFSFLCLSLVANAQTNPGAACNPSPCVSIAGGAVAGPITQGKTKFTASGCAVSAATGTSGTAGIMTSGTTGVCTVVITMNGATGMTAPTGWVCSPQNQTTANLIRQTASSTTTCTISGTTVSGDVIAFSATPY